MGLLLDKAAEKQQNKPGPRCRFGKYLRGLSAETAQEIVQDIVTARERGIHWDTILTVLTDLGHGPAGGGTWNHYQLKRHIGPPVNPTKECHCG